jgi:chorismate mutase/prephenate dehydrogenase
MEPSMETELSRLRDALGGVDRKILELAAERLRLAAEIGRAKRRSGLPTRDWAQERQVLERGETTAAEVGLSPDLARRLLLPLIDSSLTVQERDRVTAAGAGDGRRALVVGGGGLMGGWFVRFLAAQGFAVAVADPVCAPGVEAQWPDWRDGPLDQELVVVATPVSRTGPLLAELAERRPPGLVFDIASLKTPLRAGLAALVGAGVRATSLHPMFGPDTELLSGRHVVFVDVGHAEATAAARELFASTMVVPVEMGLDEHDRVIAYVLGLSHAVSIAFFTALGESGESAPRLAEVSSTTFERQLQVSRRVAEENPHLYFEIQRFNDYGTESLSALLLAIERLRSVVRAGDEEGFVRLMERGRDYLGRWAG